MCGIAGYVGEREGLEVVLDGLKRLEYRGYDSCGIATLDKAIHIKKDVGMIREIEGRLRGEELQGKTAIGHTRWATHGRVSKENAHPHVDCSSKIAIAHNGIISNFKELKEGLKDHTFVSDTDTEVLAHLIEEKFSTSLEQAVVEAVREARGTYALLALSSREPGKIVAVKKESPLLIGKGEGENFIASDISAFLPYTREAVPLDDGEYAVVTREGFEVKSLEGELRVKEPIHIEWSERAAQKEGYPHFMLKEIHEQPSTIATALSTYPQEIRELARGIERADKVYLTAAGTSLHACETAEYWFSSLAEKLVLAMDSSELEEKAVVDRNTLVVGVTQSGETYDTLSGMRWAKDRGAALGAIVNVIGSTATRMARYTIMQGSGMEISVAATKTYTSQLAVLFRTALELARLRGKDTAALEEEFLGIGDKVEEALSKEEEFRHFAGDFFNVDNYLFIGRGILLPTAREAALKLKEITYLHAEGMSGGLLKHGTISLIDEKVNTVAFLSNREESSSRMLSNVQEVRAREGRVLILGQDGKEGISLPKSSEALSPFIFAPAFQLLAYYVAVKLGRNVDRPRALAKSVTVE